MPEMGNSYLFTASLVGFYFFTARVWTLYTYFSGKEPASAASYIAETKT
jgi:hypothetical protein